MESGERQLEFTAMLGKGGFGEVYLANLRGAGGFRRRVAVKVMRDGLEGQEHLAARQRDEARLLGLLAHENIVQVLDLTTVTGRPAVIMEYVEGADLAELHRARAGKPVAVRAVVEILARAAAALAAAWRATDPDTGQPLRVVHRDIKPANLLLTASGSLKVLDFGIARADFDREGMTGSVQFGTPRYMAPEQWLGEPVGAPVDIYALGVTALELVTGRHWERAPLAPEGHDARVAQIVREALPTASRPELPDPLAPLRALLVDMLRHDPARRPSAADLVQALQRLGDDTGLPGESLGSLAARAVPPVLERKRAVLAAEPLPTPPPATPPRTPSASETPSDAPVPTPPSPGNSDPPPVSPATQPPVADPRLRAGLAAVAIGALALIAAVAWTPGEPSPAAAPPVASPSDPAPVSVAGPAAPAAVTPPPPAERPAPPVTTAASTSSAPAAPARPAPRAGSAPSRTTDAGRPAPSTPPPTDQAPATVASSTPSPTAWPFRVVSDPMGATIAVDGVTQGTTPRTLRLAPGTHRLRLTLEGSVVENEVRVGEGMPTGIRHDFTTGTGSTLR